MKKVQISLLVILVLALVVGTVYNRLELGQQLQQNLLASAAPIDAVHSLKVPERFLFCGQPVPLYERDVREKFERELHHVAYSHTNLVLSQKRAQRWFPLIEKILEQEGLPDDFKYVAVVESTLSNAVSYAGAAGFWQLMPETAQAMGLEVNDEVDERFDPEKATRAMCRYVKQIKGYVGDWVSVTAAYNVGHGSLLRSRGAQRRRSFFDLHLNAQTTAHVYRAMAVKELMENRHQYKKLARYDHRPYVPVATIAIEVKEDIPDLVAFAQAHGVAYKTLRNYNEWLQADYLKVSGKNKTYTLVLPAQDPLAQPAPEAQPDSLPVLKAGVTLL